ncbi:PolC-type DNA polymerase III [Chengkuizengella axinellae]|uniref:DNA polymerase III PolC-type n=1 Tax=Chengkuizengella axinellae TaxID=3064388 RepID=A0ABT9IW46_9BACL|nr:PolC-type DNA polymerase III [Chengkuizengella sp. 2205SS18-9]MDP5273478.1 PolC-type DNA polymerase III [Chengkuizengella sp. 2205SS18-9]
MKNLCLACFNWEGNIINNVNSEKRTRFELLMKQAEIPQEIVNSYFSDGVIDKVLCNRQNNDWNIHILKEQMVPQKVYRQFCKQIQKKFAHIAKIRFNFCFSDSISNQTIVSEFWSLYLEWIQKEQASVNGWFSKAKVEVNDQTIKVSLLDETGIELAKKKKIDESIKHFFHDFFSRTFSIQFSVDTDRTEEFNRFAEKLVEEERSAAQAILESTPSEVEVEIPEGELVLLLGKKIEEPSVPIHQVTDEEKKIVIHGTVLNLEMKELKTGTTLSQFILTDFTDSIKVKLFTKKKEDIKKLSLLKNGKWLKLRGKVEYDTFLPVHELTMIPLDLNEVVPPANLERKDQAEEKRVEFHLHSNMSTMDGITSISEYIKMAAKWGHKAIAVTDHGNVQAYPEAFWTAQKNNIKMIYGLEANVVNDAIPIVVNPSDDLLQDATYVIFDLETTGLSVVNHKIIEIAGIKVKNGEEIDRFTTFVNPHEKIPYNISQLTNITDDMVVDAPNLEDIFPKFIEFIGDAILVAHNARFDAGFVQAACKKCNMENVKNPVLDTLELARFLFPNFKNHRLNTLADKLKVSLDNHHRAIDDTIALQHIFNHLLKELKKRDISNINELNGYAGQDLTKMRPFHCCIYAMNLTGKKNLYQLISLSHTKYFHRVATIPKSVLMEYREGLLISSGCEKGELFETVLNKSPEEAEETAEFYDVLEIQPVGVNQHLIDKGLVTHRLHLEEANKRICQLGEKLNKPVIATGNVHYLHPREKINRDITIHGITGFSPLKDLEKPDVHFRTTIEMLEEFKHLGKEKAYEVVIKNTNNLSDRFEDIELFPSKPFFPVIEGADEEMRNTCYATAKEIYGEELPEIVPERLEKELVPIIKAGFSALYLISERLVKKSNQDGYLVGSRGSVGSSAVAMMLGISEVNPLPPHYLCKQCKHSEWFTDGSVRSGFDLEDKTCPKCESQMKGDGQDIPFETFLGFKGDKVPDIDLNFSGEYQPHAHHYTKVLFGEENVYRAGTIGTVAEKTAFGYVKKYEEDKTKSWRNAEVARLSSGCTGVKRSTGQHPGGIVVVPEYIDVEDITPVQYPADDTSAEWKTTHFDYHAFDANLLKLDILGHDDPTMMRMLQDLTDIDPTTIPMNDPKIMSVFNSTDALNVTPEQIKSPVGTFGVPEMGTKFVRQMLKETKPSTFADLLQISGLSHGTGVWLGNAQELIKNNTCTIKTVIGCRDDIMLYLIYKGGLEAGLAFQITESVRKGKGLRDEWITTMKEHKIPQWYIDSCLKIEYMFPKAHAAAYVISAVRTVYFKVHHPIAFYATYFSVRTEDFDVDVFCQGYNAILKRLIEIEELGFKASAKEKSMISILEMALEMTARGFSFKGINLYRSDAEKYIIDGDSLIPPFSAIQGIGVNAAKNIVEARKAGEFLSIEDFREKSKVSKTVVETLNGFGCFNGLPESNQLSLF